MKQQNKRAIQNGNISTTGNYPMNNHLNPLALNKHPQAPPLHPISLINGGILNNPTQLNNLPSIHHPNKLQGSPPIQKPNSVIQDYVNSKSWPKRKHKRAVSTSTGKRIILTTNIHDNRILTATEQNSSQYLASLLPTRQGSTMFKVSNNNNSTSVQINNNILNTQQLNNSGGCVVKTPAARGGKKRIVSLNGEDNLSKSQENSPIAKLSYSSVKVKPALVQATNINYHQLGGQNNRYGKACDSDDSTNDVPHPNTGIQYPFLKKAPRFIEQSFDYDPVGVKVTPLIIQDILKKDIGLGEQKYRSQNFNRIVYDSIDPSPYHSTANLSLGHHPKRLSTITIGAVNSQNNKVQPIDTQQGKQIASQLQQKQLDFQKKNGGGLLNGSTNITPSTSFPKSNASSSVSNYTQQISSSSSILFRNHITPQDASNSVKKDFLPYDKMKKDQFFDYLEPYYPIKDCDDRTLIFESRFQCGNL